MTKRYVDSGEVCVEDHTEKRYKLANPNNVFKDMNIGIVEDNTCMLKLVDVVNLLNEQEETIQTQKDYIIRMGHGTIFEEMKRLKERNQRQYKRLKEITDLMFKRDWKTLELMVDEWEKEEEQLQKYGG